jgi:hypothetical protein
LALQKSPSEENLEEPSSQEEIKKPLLTKAPSIPQEEIEEVKIYRPTEE